MDSGIHDRRRRLEAIDRYPWTGRVTVRLRQVKNRRAIGQMIARDAVGPGDLLHVPKEGNLLTRKRLVRFRSQREMAHDPPHRNRGEITTPGEKSRHCLRPNTDTPHTGIHLEVHDDLLSGSCLSMRQGLDHFQCTDNWFTVICHIIFAVFREGGRQHQERGAHTCFYQIDSFRHMGNAQARISETDKMTAHNLCAMPIGIRFNRWPERSIAHKLLQETHVVREMVQANEHPGCMTRTTIQVLCFSCTHEGWMLCP